jgi:endonuclease-3
MRLSATLRRLEQRYGQLQPPLANALHLILWENAAYLVDDKQRSAAFESLRKLTRLSPQRILTAPEAKLLEAARLGGMHPERRVRTWRQIALRAGELAALHRRPLAAAKKTLRQFPAIGEPGAEKIMLFTGLFPLLALESNGLRVLLRLGFGAEKKNYAATYRAVQEAAASQARATCPWLIRAHLLLRRHGQETCKRRQPRCHDCPLTAACAYFITGKGS